MRRNFTKLLLLLSLVMLLNANVVKAQKAGYEMTRLVSQDSLIFMVYGNLDEITSGPLEDLIHKQFSDELDKVFDCADEFCFSANRSNLYDCYTLRFEKSKDATELNIDDLFQKLELTKTSEESSFIKLNGDIYKKGFLRVDGKQYILKLYVKTHPVDPQIREKYAALIKQLSDGDYYSNQDIYEQIDSLSKLDSIPSQKYFDKLMDHEMMQASKREVKNPVDIKKVFGDDLKNSSGIAYFDAKKIAEIPFLLLQSTSYDDMKLFEFVNSMGGIYNYYDKLWMGFRQEQNKMIITSFANTKGKMNLFKKLDDDILCRLPAEKAKLYIVYNLNLAELKSYVIKYFASSEIKDYQRAIVKLLALAIDDDILNTFGDVSISVLDGDLNAHDMPDFKVALKVPNEKKGKLLLNILCDDLKFLRKERENYYSVDEKYNKSENPIHLFIDDDIWILGNGDEQMLKTKLTKNQISSIYPELNGNKLSQYFSLDFKALSKYDKEFQKLNMQTSVINKTNVKTVIELVTDPEEASK